MEYQCQKCGYKFNANYRPHACPYCGEIGVAKPTPTASDILEEITPATTSETPAEEKKAETSETSE